MRAAWLVAVVVVLVSSCGEQVDVTAIGRSSGPLPWQTEAPTGAATESRPSSGAPDDAASATPTPEPTETPTETLEPTETPTASPTPTPTPTPDPTPTEREDPRALAAQLEAEVVALTNAERDDEGCDPLQVDDRLRAAAIGHSEDMAERGYFEHESPEGDGPRDRAGAQGYDGQVAENIAMGFGTADDVMAEWMDSSGHRRNILSCRSDAIGVGIAESDDGQLYWTQVFGRS